MLYMVTFTINIPQMLAYIPYMDPMGNWKDHVYMGGKFHDALINGRWSEHRVSMGIHGYPPNSVAEYHQLPGENGRVYLLFPEELFRETHIEPWDFGKLWKIGRLADISQRFFWRAFNFHEYWFLRMVYGFGFTSSVHGVVHEYMSLSKSNYIKCI